MGRSRGEGLHSPLNTAISSVRVMQITAEHTERLVKGGLVREWMGRSRLGGVWLERGKEIKRGRSKLGKDWGDHVGEDLVRKGKMRSKVGGVS